MKKLLLLLVAIIAGTTIYAQGIQLGAKAGLNIAGYHGEDAKGGAPLYSYHAGAVAKIMITEKFSVQPELLYSQSGSKIVDRKGITQVDLGGGAVVNATTVSNGDTKVNYLNVPIMLKYNFYSGFNLELGPQFGYLLSKKTFTTSDVILEGKTLKSGVEKEDTNTDDLTKLDIGINVGLTYQLEYGLFLSARYNYGLNNYYKKTNEYNDDLKNQMIQFSLGYMF